MGSRQSTREHRAPQEAALAGLRALTFDVQGTCADFCQPLLRMGAEVNRTRGLAIDWAALSAGWRGLYRTVLDRIIAGEQPWQRVDRIYRETLDVLLEQHALAHLFSPAERDEINLVWSRLDPWPDSVEGLARLRRRFVVSTLSNAGMATMVAVVKHAGLPFDAVLTAELARTYKPAPAVYQLAVDYLGCRPDEIMMVACHKYDLEAARDFGMRTAFVPRPLEFGQDGAPDIGAEPWFDVMASDFIALAEALGA